MTWDNHLCYVKKSPGLILLVVMMQAQFPLSLRSIEDLLLERGIEISHETVRFWWSRFSPKPIESAAIAQLYFI